MASDGKSRNVVSKEMAAEEDDDDSQLANWIAHAKLVVSIWFGQGVIRNKEEEKMENLAAVIRTYRNPAEEDDDDSVKVWCDRTKFEFCVCCIILLNMLAISLEIDYAAPGNGRGAGWLIVECIACGFFGVEIVIKLRCHSWRWVYADAWNVVAVIIFILLVANVAFVRPLTGDGLMRLVSLIRLFWLLRLGKNAQLHLRAVEDMQLLMQGLMDSFKALVWAFMLVAIFIYIWSVLLTRQIGLNEDVYDNYRKASGGWDHEEFFGTVGKSMYTLVQCMSLDGWSSQVGRHVVNNQAIMAAFFICFMLLTTFGLLNIIVSIIVENILETSMNNQTKLRVREERARRAELESIREVFLISDADGSGTLDLGEFLVAAQTPEVQWRMRQLELPAADAAKLFEVIDGLGSRVLSIDEFIGGCTKLKGAAQSRDILALQAQADTLVRRMDGMAGNLLESERLMSALDEVSTRISRRFESAVEGSRRKIAQTVGGAKPMVPSHRQGRGPKVPLSVGNQPVLPLFPDLR